MRSSPSRHLSVAFAALLLTAACGAPTASTRVSPSVVSSHRARWTAHGITAYQYDYLVTGYLNTLAGHEVRLVVRDGAVRSAIDVASGDSLSLAAIHWPTVDDLFDEAERAASADALLDIQFDPALDYPTTMSFAGPPDASGAEQARHLEPLP